MTRPGTLPPRSCLVRPCSSPSLPPSRITRRTSDLFSSSFWYIAGSASNHISCFIRPSESLSLLPELQIFFPAYILRQNAYRRREIRLRGLRSWPPRQQLSAFWYVDHHPGCPSCCPHAPHTPYKTQSRRVSLWNAELTRHLAFLDRPLQHINKKGRPVSQCAHCRAMRKSRSAHVKCDCGIKPNKCIHLQPRVNGHTRKSQSSVFPSTALSTIPCWQHTWVPVLT